MMLSVRPLSRAELKKKLHDKELSWEVAEKTVLDCERLGFVNDPETAESAQRSAGYPSSGILCCNTLTRDAAGLLSSGNGH